MFVSVSVDNFNGVVIQPKKLQQNICCQSDRQMDPNHCNLNIVVFIDDKGEKVFSKNEQLGVLNTEKRYFLDDSQKKRITKGQMQRD